MEAVKHNELLIELSKLKPDELMAFYIEAKTGLKNPLIELPMYLTFTLSDITDWIDQFNKVQLVKQAS